jgi:6,7-dimethyl-8-ribityllumazine synthase
MHPIDNTSFNVDYLADLESGTRALVVASTFYGDITAQLLDGTLAVLREAKCQVTTLTVPGSLEIPIMVSIALEQAEKQGTPYHAVVVLGCVIRGETSHYDIVVRESARAIMDVAVAKAIPLGNGILTVETLEQAQVRAKPRSKGAGAEGDLGGRAAKAALILQAHKTRLARELMSIAKEKELCIAEG